MRSDLGIGHTKLKPPIVIGGAVAWHGPGVRLATTSEIENRIRRRHTRYTLRAPAVVNAASVTQIYFGPIVHLNVQLPELRRGRVTRRNPDYELKPPVVVARAGIFFGPTVRLQAQLREQRRLRVTRRSPDYELKPPVVVATPAIYFGPAVHLQAQLPEQRRTRVTRRNPDYELKPPAVIGDGIVNPGLRIKLIPISVGERRRQDIYSKLRAPAVVNAVSTQIFFGPKVTLNVMLPEARRTRVTRRSPDYELKPPAVVGSGIYFRGPFVYLAPQKRGKPKSKLRLPVVVFLAVEISGPEISLSYSRKGKPKSFLRPPAITASNLRTLTRLSAVTNRQQRIRRAPHSVLSPPEVVGAGVYFRGPATFIVRGRRPVTHLKLKPPVVVNAAQQAVVGAPEVHLAASKRGKPSYDLAPPAVINAAYGPMGGVMVSLAPQRRPVTKAVLHQPVVVNAQQQILYGLSLNTTYQSRRRGVARLKPPADTIGLEDQGHITVSLARSSRGRPVYELRPEAPGANITFFGPIVTLAPSRRGLPHSRLFAPTDVIDVIEEGLLRTHLAYSRRGHSIYELRPPVVVYLAVEIYGPVVGLAPSFQGKAKPSLKAPTDVIDLADQGRVEIHLAPQKRGVPKSKLFPPAVIGAGIVYRPVQVELTYSRRGVPKSAIFPGLVGRDIYYGPRVNLAPSFRGKPKYFLRTPQVVNRPLARAIQIFLAPQARGIPQNFLRPAIIPPLARSIAITLAPQTHGNPKSRLGDPVVVREAVEIYGPSVELAPSRFPKTQSALRPAVVVGHDAFFGPIVRLAPSFRGHPQALLGKPVVVRLAAEISGPAITLVPQRRGQPVYVLQPPVVVGRIVYYGPDVHLAPSFRGVPKSKINPPTVVRAAEYFFGPEVHLTRITPPKVVHLRVVAYSVEQPFIPPRGDDCGFDTSNSIICFLESSGTAVIGGDRSDPYAFGTTESGDTITGSDRSSGDVIGGDQEAN